MATSLGRPCPCGSSVAFEACCGPLLRGERLPASAEALMRSRYTAYVLADDSYLLATWHPHPRPASLGLDEPQPHWLGLRVKSSQDLDDNHARVQFVARYKIGGRAFRLEEMSRFERVAGRWFYVDGEVT